LAAPPSNTCRLVLSLGGTGGILPPDGGDAGECQG